MTSPATDNDIRTALEKGLTYKAIRETLHVGQKRIQDVKATMPEAAKPEAPIVEPGDEAEPLDEPYEPGPTDTVTVKADYLHALEAVVILTHMLAAAREAA